MRMLVGLVAAAFVLTSPRAGAQATWPNPDPAYGFVPAAGCDRPRPTGSTAACTDHMVAFVKARAEAAAAGKSLLVVFGATWCPSCKTMQTALPEALVAGGLAGRLHVVDVTISTVAMGKVTEVPSGETVRADLMRARPDFRQRAIPFFAMIDPATGRTSARNLDDLEQGGSWSRTGLAGVLALAEAEVRGGQTAPGEPSWFGRKWRRWFGG